MKKIVMLIGLIFSFISCNCQTWFDDFKCNEIEGGFYVDGNGNIIHENFNKNNIIEMKNDSILRKIETSGISTKGKKVNLIGKWVKNEDENSKNEIQNEEYNYFIIQTIGNQNNSFVFLISLKLNSFVDKLLIASNEPTDKTYPGKITSKFRDNSISVFKNSTKDIIQDYLFENGKFVIQVYEPKNSPIPTFTLPCEIVGNKVYFEDAAIDNEERPVLDKQLTNDLHKIGFPNDIFGEYIAKYELSNNTIAYIISAFGGPSNNGNLALVKPSDYASTFLILKKNNVFIDCLNLHFNSIISTDFKIKVEKGKFITTPFTNGFTKWNVYVYSREEIITSEFIIKNDKFEKISEHKKTISPIPFESYDVPLIEFPFKMSTNNLEKIPLYNVSFLDSLNKIGIPNINLLGINFQIKIDTLKKINCFLLSGHDSKKTINYLVLTHGKRFISKIKFDLEDDKLLDIIENEGIVFITIRNDKENLEKYKIVGENFIEIK